MKYTLEETITYAIEADSEEDARDRWQDLPTPQVEAPDGVIYTETLGLTSVYPGGLG